MAYLPALMRKRLAAGQGGICPWCKLPLPDDCADTTLDHIIPRSRGGPDKSWNRQVLHAKCNGPAGKGSKLTAEAIALAAEHGIVLYEPLPTAWPGSSRVGGSRTPNPGRRLTPTPTPPLPTPLSAVKPPLRHKVAVRKIYEVECRTCECIIGTEDSWEKAQRVKRDHVAQARGGHEHEDVA
jgi:hypothetical protein